MVTRYAIPLRKLILSRTSIKHIIDVSELGVFVNVSVYPVILILELSNYNKNNKIKHAKISNLMHNGKMNMPKFAFIDQDIYFATPDNMFISTLDDSNISLTSKMKTLSSPLGDFCNINEGIHTGNLRDKLVVAGKVDDNNLSSLSWRKF
jgi:hypothetical protein